MNADATMLKSRATVYSITHFVPQAKTAIHPSFRNLIRIFTARLTVEAGRNQFRNSTRVAHDVGAPYYYFLSVYDHVII